jgi:hypothetical protein
MRNPSVSGKFAKRCLGISLAFEVVFTSFNSAVENRSKPLQLQVVERASFFLPDSLRKILTRNQQSFEKGIDSFLSEPFLSPAGRSRLEEELMEKMKAMIQALRSHPRFSEMARDFGAVAAMVLYLNLPEGESLKKEDFPILLNYVTQNSSTFPLVVYDVSDNAEGLDFLSSFINTVRLRRQKLSARFGQVYPQMRSENSASETGPRSALFGLSSLVYSHTINDVARIWLWAWQSANGDMAGKPAMFR